MEEALDEEILFLFDDDDDAAADARTHARTLTRVDAHPRAGGRAPSPSHSVEEGEGLTAGRYLSF